MRNNFQRRLWYDPWFITGALIILFLLSLSLVGPVISFHDPHDMSFVPLSGPSTDHILGTNDAGMDIFSELLVGLRNTVVFGIIAGSFSLLLGVAGGLFAAWYEGLVDLILMRIAEVLLAIPAIMVLILVAAFFRPSPWLLALILGILSWPAMAKSFRAQALTVKNSLHVRAAKQMGASSVYVILKHLLPALFPLYIIGFASRARMAMFMEASLAFLGLFDPGRKSLGIMISYALKYYYLDVWWHWLFPPILFLSLSIMAATFVAISFEKVFDPRLKEVFS